ncbi:hypothetical protein [Methyloceanibacter caenitepidi]|uniref:Uncharacterized protein n=1 Tax=Methyloceanibacter caenitepidi TaxID=1384459 RepID=A0A0A8K4N9_9HYPH|nr:hypothetical protein [Methyloceanibacter caenitepidi]BAQ16969.1 hypothetical protein GL4_1513 [Methyloceanibacter caenitepidi]
MTPELARLNRAAVLYVRSDPDKRQAVIGELGAARKAVTPKCEAGRALVSAAFTVAVYPRSEAAIDLLEAAYRLVCDHG